MFTNNLITQVLLCFILGLMGFLNSLSLAQHDRERNAFRYLAEDKIDQAYHELKNGKKHTDPAEKNFISILCLLHEGRIDKALGIAQEAVRDGLPFERLLSEPREWLAPLREYPAFIKWKKEVSPSPLLHGPMLGRVTDTGASFWFRTDGSQEVAVEISGHSGRESIRTRKENRFVGVIELDGLLPGTYFAYQVFVNGEEIKLPGVDFGFRTFPQADEGDKFTLAFGGCAGFVPEYEKTWALIADHEPRATLMLGDNVYIDDPKNAQLTGNYCYSRRHSRPEWRKLVAGSSMHAIYDDHDFGTDDCIPGPYFNKPSWKGSVFENFKRNWNNPRMGGGEESPGCWHSFTLGKVQIIMLDCRHYRDLKGKTMLGPVQKKWLKNTLIASDAAFKLIASSVPFSAGVKPGSQDPWDGYPIEREEIFTFIEKEKIEGVVLIAADRHRIDLRKTLRPKGYDLYEFVSGRLTNRHVHPVVQTDGLIWGYNKTCGFSLLRFNTRLKDPVLLMEAFDLNGEKIFSHEIKASTLSFNE